MKSPTNAPQASSGHQSFFSEHNTTSQCTCVVGAVELNTIHGGESDLAVDTILNLARQAIDFWQRLKNCRPCLEARLEELLATFDKVVNFLNTTAYEAGIPTTIAFSDKSHGSRNGAKQGLGTGVGAGSLPYLAPASSSAHKTNIYGTAMHPQPTQTPPMTIGGGILPMSLGRYTLDQQQSLVLFKTTYRHILGQVASILYEMRQVEGGLDVRLNGAISDLLYGVLHPMERFNEWGIHEPYRQ